MSTPKHHVYLIPGFFGFANFGEIKYFAHVTQWIEHGFAERGIPVEVHYVRTLPTASIERRAMRLAEVVQATAKETDHLHLVGHSSGGLDARLFAAPDSGLPDTEPFAQQVKSVVTIASPHFGVPQVSTFVSAIGPSLLRALSMITVHGVRFGSVPLPALVALAGVLPRVGKFEGPVLSILDQIYERLLKDFDESRGEELEKFLLSTTEDQTLLTQLAPSAMTAFNRSTTRRPTTRYGCVVVQGREPSWRAAIDLGISPTAQATYAIYRALYLLAAQSEESTASTLSAADERTLRSCYGETPSAAANDAIVPVLSQVYGEIVHATWGDHLDVVGHFEDATTRPPHVEWLSSHSGFDQTRFERLWDDVCDFLLSDEPSHA